jgi:hypothetical protein
MRIDTTPSSLLSLHLQRTAELAELPVVIVYQEFGLLLEAGVPGLWSNELLGQQENVSEALRATVDDVTERLDALNQSDIRPLLGEPLELEIK